MCGVCVRANMCVSVCRSACAHGRVRCLHRKLEIARECVIAVTIHGFTLGPWYMDSGGRPASGHVPDGK